MGREVIEKALTEAYLFGFMRGLKIGAEEVSMDDALYMERYGRQLAAEYLRQPNPEFSRWCDEYERRRDASTK